MSKLIFRNRFESGNEKTVTIKCGKKTYEKFVELRQKLKISGADLLRLFMMNESIKGLDAAMDRMRLQEIEAQQAKLEQEKSLLLQRRRKNG